MSVSILPYDNISNRGDLGVGLIHAQRLAGKMESGSLSSRDRSPSRGDNVSKLDSRGRWLHIVWLLIYLMVYQGGYETPEL